MDECYQVIRGHPRHRRHLYHGTVVIQVQIGKNIVHAAFSQILVQMMMMLIKIMRPDQYADVAAVQVATVRVTLAVVAMKNVIKIFGNRKTGAVIIDMLGFGNHIYGHTTRDGRV
tara:strand:- start:67 stop:411 length:345 start_codon:yes stop_codon:yes gene_type:complete